MPFFESAHGRMHYRRWPVMDDPQALVALLPGIGQHTGHYHRFARGLGAANIEVWGLDTAGQGLSEGDPEVPGLVDDLAVDAQALLDLIRAERPDGPLIVVGHSLGAGTALYGRFDCVGIVASGVPERATIVVPELQEGVPALILHGSDDRRAPIEPVRQWTRQQPLATFREYSDAGHDLLHEPVHARVTADIIEWIRDVVVAAPVRRR
ncbi:alpha/beta hydrolase [Nocardia sp. alder85J]|uniref:alpha/beta hydrolase n=1 Tax=Nocardia sp. alder85J TaxID=2862949 RepID=UPI001CD38FE4|nr:alpha/beta fold hydrolase [Nocardia sp. alder85J]MCX4095971.1 alpha/beta fold hydrolase [Nocardia sp. alder85J]